MYTQIFDPVAHSVGASAAFAALPLFTLFVLLGVLRLQARWAALASLAVSVAVAIFVYGMPAGQTASGALEGAAIGFFPIIWIGINAIWLFKLTQESGHADVLRRDPSLTDAAYNYEYVARLRDTIAREKPATRAAREKKLASAAKPEEVSVDLPAGPTIHGLPGGPPEGVPMSDFKTLSPMRYDEREEQMEPGRGKAIRRKG